MVTFIKGNGVMTRPMGKESTFITMELFTRETGRMTSSTDMVLKPGLMKPDMRERTSTARSMEKANFSGMTEQVTQENSA